MDKKNTLLLTVIAVATLLVAIVGATFAYFTAQTGAGAQVDVKVKTETADTTMFNTPEPLNIFATQFNFNEESGTATHSLIDSSYASVSYTANSQTNKGDYCYKVGLVVTKNEFVYSLPKTQGDAQGDFYPELLFRIWKVQKDGTLTDLKGEEFQPDEFGFQEYGTSKTHNVEQLYVADGTEFNEQSEENQDVNVPYKTVSATATQLCEVNVDTKNTENCKTGELSGYDITMLGFSDKANQDIYKNSNDPLIKAKYFDYSTAGKIIDKKIALIPNDDGTYEHQITIKATDEQKTKNDYWRFDVIFVNYSDKDIHVSTTPGHEDDDGAQTGLGDQNKNVDKELTATIRFIPLKQCTTPKADSE